MRLLKRQDGIVSLLTVALTAIVMTTVAVGTATIMTGELRQAQDAEASTVAYYVARSASEEAVAAVYTQLKSGAALSTLNQNCDSDTNFTGATPIGSTYYDNSGGVQITCRSIATTAETVSRRPVEKDTADQYDLSGANSDAARGGIQTLRLGWSNQDKAPTYALSGTSIADSANSASWPTGAPPAMEITFVTHGSGVTPASKTVILQPSTASGTAGLNINVSTVPSTPPTAAGNVYTIRCAPNAAGQDCAATFSNFSTDPNRWTVTRVKPRFANAVYDMQVLDNNDQLYPIPLQNARIDITARVGSSYRRIIKQVPIRSGPYADYVLYGDVDLCKRLQVVAGAPFESIDAFNGRGCAINPPFAAGAVPPDTVSPLPDPGGFDVVFPSSPHTASSILTLNGTAGNATRIDVFYNGVDIGDGTITASNSWTHTRGPGNGTYVIRVVAYNSSNQVIADETETVVLNYTPSPVTYQWDVDDSWVINDYTLRLNNLVPGRSYSLNLNNDPQTITPAGTSYSEMYYGYYYCDEGGTITDNVTGTVANIAACNANVMSGITHSWSLGLFSRTLTIRGLTNTHFYYLYLNDNYMDYFYRDGTTVTYTVNDLSGSSCSRGGRLENVFEDKEITISSCTNP